MAKLSWRGRLRRRILVVGPISEIQRLNSYFQAENSYYNTYRKYNCTGPGWRIRGISRGSELV